MAKRDAKPADPETPETALSPQAEGAEGPTYEEAVGELESLIERIESGEIGLEASIDAYERGVSLIKRCRAILDRAEQRIEQIEAGRLDRLACGEDEPETRDDG